MTVVSSLIGWRPGIKENSAGRRSESPDVSPFVSKRCDRAADDRKKAGSVCTAANLALCLITIIHFTILAAWPASAAEPEKFLTGNEFTRQLNRPLLANLDYSPIRQVLNRFSEERRIAVDLDRRIDPSQLVLVDLQTSYFDEGIRVLATRLSADVVVLADMVFVTTPVTAQTLRTRIALAEKKLEELPKSSFARQVELSRKVPWHWKDVTSPRDLLVEFANRFEVRIENPEAIPYDLWAAGDVPHANFVSGVLLIAAQYDLDFEWHDTHQIRLVPQAPEPVIEQEHPLRGRSLSQAMELIRNQFPHCQIQAVGERLQVTALVEEQEKIAVLLGNRSPRKPTALVMDTSLANRRFTLRMQSRPFSELLNVLEKQGIQFERNSAQLNSAGIDLDQRITLELENATIEKLLTDACSPLGLAYQVDGTRIILGVAPRPVPRP